MVKKNARLFAMPDKIFIQGLETKCLIGVFDWERKIRQKVVIDLEFPANVRKAAVRDALEDAIDYKRIAKCALAFVSKSRFRLIETLAEKLALMLLKGFPALKQIRIRISKPGAIRGSKNVGVEIRRRRK
ncbi:MAG: dihydroneopterin aldolase [Candidatus Omnitrophica bacterium]|nr:dihydroneopterin aldolase [Candidatus Omnitrophota bacterium]MDD5670120.1 dihydroneopterin aldolase [Candidatus Omnitrophota bacterium]